MTITKPARYIVPPCGWTRKPAFPMCYGHVIKERIMRPISGFFAVALTLLALAGCSTTAADNTTYSRPPESGGMRVPLN